MYTLRPYQREAVDTGVNFLSGKSENNALIVAPTGSGKSLIISNIVKRMHEPVLVFQPSKELLEQNVEKYLYYGGVCEVYSASAGRKKIAPVTFATIGSVYRKPELFDKFRCCIVDECHLVNPAEDTMYQSFFSKLNMRVLGLTATPIRNKVYAFPEAHTKSVIVTRMRPRFFTRIIHVTQIRDMVTAGYFAKTKYHKVDFDSRGLVFNSTGAAYTEQSIDAVLDRNDTVGRVISMFKKLDAKGAVKHILIFTDRVHHAEAIAKATGCRLVSGDTPKKARERILSDFKKGKTKGVVNVGVLTTGFDFPELDCIIMARPTMSIALYYQMIGRGVRPHPSKEVCHVVDMVGNLSRFGRVEDFVFENIPHKGWVLHNGKTVLTNRDLKELSTKPEPVDGEPVMTFGKYKGLPISHVPANYLVWFCSSGKVEKTHWNAYVFDWVEKNMAINKQ